MGELEHALAELLPPAGLAPLLRACAADGEVAIAGFGEWRERAGDPLAALTAGGPAVGRLGALLAWNLARAGAPIAERELRNALRAALTRERERAATMAAGVDSALSVLTEAGVDWTLLGGVDVARRAYPDPGLRHCHDVDLLLGPGDRGRAIDALATRGGQAPVTVGSRGSIVVAHPDGAPVSIHRRPVAMAGVRWPLAATLARRDGGSLAADDLVLQLIAHGLCDTHAADAKWVPDAAFAIRALGERIDWERFAATARAAGLDAVAAAGLRYLDRELGVAGVAGRLGAPSRAGADLAIVAALRSWRRPRRPRDLVALARHAPRYVRDRWALIGSTPGTIAR